MPSAGSPLDRAHYDNDADRMIKRDKHGHLVLRELQQDGGCASWTATTAGRAGARMGRETLVVWSAGGGGQGSGVRGARCGDSEPDGGGGGVDAFALAVAGLVWRGEVVVAAGDPSAETTGW